MTGWLRGGSTSSQVLFATIAAISESQALNHFSETSELTMSLYDFGRLSVVEDSAVAGDSHRNHCVLPELIRLIVGRSSEVSGGESAWIVRAYEPGGFLGLLGSVGAVYLELEGAVESDVNLYFFQIPVPWWMIGDSSSTVVFSGTLIDESLSLQDF